jgi:hypothetical protein
VTTAHLLSGGDWLSFSERLAALAVMVDHARLCRLRGGMSARMWLLSVVALADAPGRNPDADEMIILPSIAVGWVWGYQKPS